MTLQYVVGFMLDEARENVILIEKNRPAWQAGKLNGVGGKMDPGESAPVAMTREFYEETGAWTDPWTWKQMCAIEWPDDTTRVGSASSARVTFFRYIYKGEKPMYDVVRTNTDEPVHRIPVLAVQSLPVVPNLRWLVPLAAYTADCYEPFVLQATVAEAV